MKKITLSIYLLMLSAGTLFAQNNNPIVVEAEDGTLGSDYAISTDFGATSIYPQTDLADGDMPLIDGKVVTYTVTFPEAGTYDLYVRLYIGPGAGVDDSFFTANSFGVKSASNASDWIKQNETDRGGQTEPTDIVTGELGSVLAEAWKWINLSQFDKAASKVSYTVPAGNLTQTFQIGAREDGLNIDKFVFGKTGFSYTVANLDSGTLSVKKIDDLDSFNMYPNPFNDEFTIESKNQSGTYAIYNLLGAKVEEGVLNLGTNTYGKSLNSGNYILNIISDNNSSVKKIIKR